MLQVFRQVEGEWLASTAILWLSSVYGRITWMHGSSSSHNKSSSSEVGIPSWVEHTGGPQKPCLMPNASQSSKSHTSTEALKSQFSDMSQSLRDIRIFRNPFSHCFWLQLEPPANHAGLHSLSSQFSHIVRNGVSLIRHYNFLLPQHTLIPFITLSMKRTAGLTGSPSSLTTGRAPRFTGMLPTAPESLLLIHPL